MLQTVLAIPLWALLHMTPEQTFVGSQRQGYLMLLSLLVRPALAVIGLFAAILVSDPLVTFVVNGFFAIREAVEGGDAGYMSYLSALPMFLWWMIALSFLLIPVLQMCFGLPQILPGAVLQWIGAGISDLGESGATGKLQSGLAANNVPGNKLGRIQNKPLWLVHRRSLRLGNSPPPSPNFHEKLDIYIISCLNMTLLRQTHHLSIA